MKSPRYALIVPLAALLVALALAGCKSGGGDATPTAAPTEEPQDQATPTLEPVETPTPADAEPSTFDFSLCLLEGEEADEALGEFVTGIPGGNLNCTYQTDSGIYLRIEPGSPDDLGAGAELEGVPGEAVAGIGEEAAWFDGVQLPSHHFDFDEIVSLGVLSLRQGDVYLRIMLNLPEADSATQMEIAGDVAAIALANLP